MQTLDSDSFPTLAATSLAEAPWLVLKFGGTSVSTAQNWATIHDLVNERAGAGYRPLVVHSALAGVSNRIDDALQKALGGDFRRTV